MVIQICLETHDPPSGTVAVEGRAKAALPFVGWLGLLRVLSEAFTAGSDLAAAVPPSGRGDGGQHPRRHGEERVGVVPVGPPDARSALAHENTEPAPRREQ